MPDPGNLASNHTSATGRLAKQAIPIIAKDLRIRSTSVAAKCFLDMHRFLLVRAPALYHREAWRSRTYNDERNEVRFERAVHDTSGILNHSSTNTVCISTTFRGPKKYKQGHHFGSREISADDTQVPNQMASGGGVCFPPLSSPVTKKSNRRKPRKTNTSFARLVTSYRIERLVQFDREGERRRGDLNGQV